MLLFGYLHVYAAHTSLLASSILPVKGFPMFPKKIY
jgi:hypothetical protein